jgi:hypothetical protein
MNSSSFKTLLVFNVFRTVTILCDVFNMPAPPTDCTATSALKGCGKWNLQENDTSEWWQPYDIKNILRVLVVVVRGGGRRKIQRKAKKCWRRGIWDAAERYVYCILGSRSTDVAEIAEKISTDETESEMSSRGNKTMQEWLMMQKKVHSDRNRAKSTENFATTMSSISVIIR